MTEFKFKNEIIEKLYWDRYAVNGESIDKMIERVATALSSDEGHRERLISHMSNGYMFGAGRVMAGAGVGNGVTLNNCFTSNFVGDSMKEIFDKIKDNAMVHKLGGGNGNEFSMLRPNGSKTSTGAIASGVTSFMDVFDSQTKTVMVGSRRGANMAVLSVYHPDIIEYVTAKSKDPNRLTQFNMSVMVDDKFMQAVESDSNIYLRYPVYNKDGSFTEEKDWIVKQEVKASDIWNTITENAYNYGEPGVLMYDTLNRFNNVSYAETIVNTNPCGEFISGVLKDFPLAKGCCNLSSIYLHNMVKKPFTKDSEFDYATLRNVCWDIVEMLDNVVDRNTYPDQFFEDYQRLLRTIGVGTTGLATTLQMMNLKYGSKEGNKFIDELYDSLAQYLYDASSDLAKKRGAFKLFDKEKFMQSEFLKTHTGGNWDGIKDKIEKYGIRNARLISIAPSGTTSLVFGNNCSSGIEPVFMYEYNRDMKVGGQTDADIKTVTMNDYGWGLYKELFGSDSEMPEHFVNAMELTVDEHIETLACIAKHVDMAISKTINIPTDYPFEDTKHVFMDAWKKGIKGVTIFRPNELRAGIFNSKPEEPKESDDYTQLEWGTVIESSDDLIGRKTKIQTGCGSLHISGFFDELTGDLMEVFLNKGGNGGCQGYMGGLSRMISLSLRAGVPFDTVIEQLTSVQGCPSYVVRTKLNKDTAKGNNCSSAIGFALSRMMNEVKYELGIIEEAFIYNKQSSNSTLVQIESKSPEIKDVSGEEFYEKCPECGEKSPRSSACFSCINCGYSKCS